MEYQTLKPCDPEYPKRLIGRIGETAPVLYCQGPLKLLDRFTLAVIASDRSSGRSLLSASPIIDLIARYGINYIGGWHSVIETEVFRQALRRRDDPHCIRSLTMVSARGLDHENWEGFLADRFGHEGPFTGFPEKEEYLRRAREGELLMLSVTEPSLKKMTRQNIIARNYVACALADAIYIPFAEKGTKTYILCKRIMAMGIPIFTSECEENADLYELGIQGYGHKKLGAFLEELGASTSADSSFSHENPGSAKKNTTQAPLPPHPSQVALFGK